MIVPYSTDAPLYHWPITTISIIVINVILYFTTMFQFHLGNFEQEQVSWLVLEFDTINPFQWVTGAFMHYDLTHLVSNMFFLYAFGLIVEGKIGNVAFAVLYLFIAFVDGAIVQIPMYLLGSEDVALGASGVIFGILVIAVLWAPENELDCFWLVFIYWGTFEARVIVFGGWYIGIQFLLTAITGFSMSSAMLHVVGILIGLPIGFLLLRLGLVDCEGWDIVSRNPWLHSNPFFYSPEALQKDNQDRNDTDDPVTAALALSGGQSDSGRRLGTTASRPFGTALESPKKSPPDKKSNAPPPRRPPNLQSSVDASGSASSMRQRQCKAHPEFNRLAFLIRQGLQTNDIFSAQQAFQQLDDLKLTLGLSETTLMQLVELLGREKQWVNAIRPLAVIAEQRGVMADDALLRLAQIQLRILNRPDLATITLNKIESPLPDQEIAAPRQEKLNKRDELLATAQRIANTR